MAELKFDSKLKLVSEWTFELEGQVYGPYQNAITPAGFGAVADLISRVPAPWLAIGNNTSDSFVLGETFRSPVSLVTRDQNTVRFRTQLPPPVANGNHEKFSILFYASATPGGSEIMFNQLRRPFSKASNQTLTVECRVHIIAGG